MDSGFCPIITQASLLQFLGNSWLGGAIARFPISLPNDLERTATNGAFSPQMSTPWTMPCPSCPEASQILRGFSAALICRDNPYASASPTYEERVTCSPVKRVSASLIDCCC